MYQALYRKYRPKNFSEVVGQNVIVQTLKNSIINNSINHAYLFSGPRGTGKTSMAKIFANTINCESIVNGEKCNNCVFCTQNKNDDIIEIDAASNNGVDEIRELRSKVSLVPSLGKYKVYIIDEVHMLTVGAFNALLKTLEEPPNHAVFILATTEPHKIPLTILSRCQQFNFKKISENTIFERLSYIANKEKINITKDAIMEIATTCDGGMRDAISMLDQAHSYSSENIDLNVINDINGNISEEEIYNLTKYIIDKNLSLSYELIDKYIKEGKNLIKISEKLLLNFRNILLYKNAKEYFENKISNINFIKNISQEIDNDKFLKIIMTINNRIALMKKNDNPKLILELMFIELLNYDNKNTINETTKDLSKQREESTEKILVNDVFEKTKENNKIKDQNLINESEEFIKNIEKLKKIRINNTLAKFNKKEYLKLSRELDNVRSMILNPDHSKAASIVVDGTLKAASDKNIIYVYNTQSMVDIFNSNIPIIELLIKELLNIEYKCIATSIDDWEKIKTEFNNHQKKYELIEENDLFKKTFNEEKIEEKKDDIEKMFGNIIEYN